MGKNKLLIGFFFALLLLITIEFYVYANFSKITDDIINVSFVVTGDNLDAWENMKSGAQTASLDNNVQVSFLNSPPSAGAKGEIEMIERQLSEGADYVVVASGFFEEVNDYVGQNNLYKKVSFIKNGFADSKIGVFANDYKLGQDYANFIKDKFSPKNLLILYSDESINNSNTINGLKEGFLDTDIEIAVEQISEDTGLVDKYIKNAIDVGFYDGAIIMDSFIIDEAVSLDELKDSSFNIYGIDDRQAAVYYLDSDLIKALACKDDYTMGFIAVKRLVSKKEITETPLYYIVERADIYSEKYEKVLFPFAK